MQTIINQNVTLSYKICLINYFKLFEMQPLIPKTNNKSNDVNSLWQHGNKLCIKLLRFNNNEKKIIIVVKLFCFYFKKCELYCYHLYF